MDCTSNSATLPSYHQSQIDCRLGFLTRPHGSSPLTSDLCLEAAPVAGRHMILVQFHGSGAAGTPPHHHDVGGEGGAEPLVGHHVLGEKLLFKGVQRHGGEGLGGEELGAAKEGAQQHLRLLTRGAQPADKGDLL